MEEFKGTFDVLNIKCSAESLYNIVESLVLAEGGDGDCTVFCDDPESVAKTFLECNGPKRWWTYEYQDGYHLFSNNQEGFCVLKEQFCKHNMAEYVIYYEPNEDKE